MDTEQFNKIIDEVGGEFFADSADHFRESYYGKFLKESEQDRFDDYFLFTAFHREALMDCFAQTRSWAIGKDREAVMAGDGFDMQDLENMSREISSTATSTVMRYTALGYRRGYDNGHVESKKGADGKYEELVGRSPFPEESTLSGHYRLNEMTEQITASAVMHSAHMLAHKEGGLSWESLQGGFCFGMLTACMHAWAFGGRVAEMVLMSEEMQFDVKGERDGQATEKEGPGDD